MNRTVAKILIWSALGCVVLFAAVFALGYYDGYRAAHSPGVAPREFPAWLFFLVIAGTMAGSIWVGAIWMRSIDEAAQEAHKSAWYWGGSCGLALGSVVALMAILPQAATFVLPTVLPDRTDPAAYMVTGAALMALVMIAGYGIAWVIWWLRRR
ncbi:MAG: hypothetical protein K2X25_14825 [Caulobacteraceae bacterium]|nr:hypothetical protein [Caulobacteraceae bacterium]